jgi:hypothetical protein
MMMMTMMMMTMMMTMIREKKRCQQRRPKLRQVSGWGALPEPQVWGAFDRVQDAVEELIGPS